jgi:tetratricopeptide (TPR) repeat protein
MLHCQINAVCESFEMSKPFTAIKRKAYLNLVFLGLLIVSGLFVSSPIIPDDVFQSEYWRADAAYNRGERAEAKHLLRQSLRKNPSDAASAMRLGDMMKEEGRFAEAESLLKQALQIDRRLFGSESWEATLPVLRLATLYEQDGRLDMAQNLFEDVIRICSKSPDQGFKSLHLAYASAGLARIYRLKGHSRQAKLALEQAFKIYKKQLGKSDPLTRHAKQDLATIDVK